MNDETRCFIAILSCLLLLLRRRLREKITQEITIGVNLRPEIDRVLSQMNEETVQFGKVAIQLLIFAVDLLVILSILLDDLVSITLQLFQFRLQRVILFD